MQLELRDGEQWIWDVHLGAGILVEYPCPRIHIKVTQGSTVSIAAFAIGSLTEETIPGPKFEATWTNSPSSVFQCTDVLGFIIQSHSLETKELELPNIVIARAHTHMQKAGKLPLQSTAQAVLSQG